MGLYNFVRGISARFIKDDNGSMAMAWGISLLVIVLAVGSAFDTSQASKAKLLAQRAADNMALAASISVDRGNQEQFVEGREYSYAEIGGPTEDFTGTMAGKVEYDVIDGDDKLIARATIEGEYSTAFMSIIGIDKIGLRAVSDVAYAEAEGVPSSVFFVVDNSGSMWDKMTSLESSMKDFMETMETLDNDGTQDTFRTALYPYTADYPDSYYCPTGCYPYVDDDGIIPTHVVEPDWGTLSVGYITRMIARHGTDSSGALEDAATAYKGENAAHIAVNGEEDPLKFLVFMTDGANNTSYECTTESVWVENKTAEYWWKYKNNGSKKVMYQEPNNSWKWNYVASTSDGTGYFEDQEVCAYDYHFDARSLASCDEMKEDGVLIYAIAYDVDASQKEHAEDFMQKCSSGDDFFKTASDATALDEAFEAIGESILKEVIRIKR